MLCALTNLAIASQARPTSAADTAEAGRPPKLLLKLSIGSGSAERGQVVAGQAGSRAVQLPPSADSGPQADESNTQEQASALNGIRFGQSSGGVVGPAAHQPAGIVHALPPSVTTLSAEDRATVDDWPALLAALRGWSESRSDALHLPPAIRDPRVCSVALEWSVRYFEPCWGKFCQARPAAILQGRRMPVIMWT